MELLIVFGVMITVIIVLCVVYSRQRRNDPDDIEGARRAAAHGPHGYSNTPGVGMPDYGGGGGG